MKRNLINLILLALVFTFYSTATAQNFKYIGAEKCKMCHNKPEKGEQFNKWAATPHAKAFKALSSDKGKEIAKKNGIADATTDAKCLTCHTTVGSPTPAEGVSCESCHGPGSAYKAPTVMKDIKLSKENGLIIPDNNTCAKCHTNNKLHDQKAFDFASYFAKVQHPNPEKKK